MEKIKSYLPIIVVVIVAVAIVAGSAAYMGKANPGVSKISSDEAGKKIVDYVNTVILAGKATASLDSAVMENGLYRIKFTINGQQIDSYSTLDGKLFFPEAIDLSKTDDSAKAQEQAKTIGDFSVSADEIIAENGKPVVYFFGSESCPHCVWEKPIIEKVMAKFKDQISFHENIDSEKDQDIFTKYSDGGIPTLVIAGKYYRVGSGENVGEDQEAKNLTALICKIANNAPQSVCDSVKDLVSQIKN